MKPRECTFCGSMNLDRTPETTVCNTCGVEHANVWWDERYDDWRSDDWPDGDVLVLHDGQVDRGRRCEKYVDIEGEGVMMRIEDCKWKRLPEVVE